MESGLNEQSSNSDQVHCVYFTLMPWEKGSIGSLIVNGKISKPRSNSIEVHYVHVYKRYESMSSPSSYWLNCRADCTLHPWLSTSLGKRKLKILVDGAH